MCCLILRDVNIFFFNDTATTEIYTLSLHDALPISPEPSGTLLAPSAAVPERAMSRRDWPRVRPRAWRRSEEHTSELQSRQYLVCRLLLEKKKKIIYTIQLFHLLVLFISLHIICDSL